METIINNNITYDPISVIINYRSSSDSENHQSLFYSEYAKICNNKIASGFRPISKKNINDFIKSYKNLKQSYSVIKGFIPKNLFYIDQNFESSTFVWLCPGKTRTIKYRATSYLLDIPNLIFKLQNESLYCYAIKTKIIKDTTPLYNISFGNISEDQKVCLGNVKTNNQYNSYQELIDSFEDYFFNSSFTDDLQSFNKDLLLNKLKLTLKNILK